MVAYALQSKKPLLIRISIHYVYLDDCLLFLFEEGSCQHFLVWKTRTLDARKSEHPRVLRIAKSPRLLTFVGWFYAEIDSDSSLKDWTALWGWKLQFSQQLIPFPHKRNNANNTKSLMRTPTRHGYSSKCSKRWTVCSSQISISHLAWKPSSTRPYADCDLAWPSS